MGESYCFNMKATVDDEKVKDKISDADKKAINDKCDEAIKWLDGNQLGEKDDFLDKQKEVEAVCSLIVTKLYQGAGGAPGGMPGAGTGGSVQPHRDKALPGGWRGSRRNARSWNRRH